MQIMGCPHRIKNKPCGKKVVLSLRFRSSRKFVYLLVSLLNLVLSSLRLDVEGVVELRLLDHGSV
jgi:hypothetical protein